MIEPEISSILKFYRCNAAGIAQWYTDDFAELTSATATLAIGSIRTMSLFGDGLITQASNNSVIIEFRVENVDDEFERIKEFIDDIVQPPTTMP